MSIVQFAEDVLGIKHLSYHQKEILMLIEHNRHEKIVLTIHGMRNGKTMINEICKKYKELHECSV